MAMYALAAVLGVVLGRLRSGRLLRLSEERIESGLLPIFAASALLALSYVPEDFDDGARWAIVAASYTLVAVFLVTNLPGRTGWFHAGLLALTIGFVLNGAAIAMDELVGLPDGLAAGASVGDVLMLIGLVLAIAGGMGTSPHPTIVIRREDLL